MGIFDSKLNFLSKNIILLQRKEEKNVEEEKIEKLLLSIIEKIEKRDDLLIELTKEIALLRLEIKQNHNL